METYFSGATQALLLCVSGPDVGKRFVVDSGARILGRSGACHVPSDDPEVAPEHLVFTMMAGRPTFETRGTDVYLDGQPVTRGKLRQGQQLRIGRSIWQVADEDAAQQFAGWLGRIGGHLSAAAGVGKIEGFSPSKMFSDVFRKRRDEEIEDYVVVGTPANTPAVTEISNEWPRPWLFARAATLSILAYLGFLFAASNWENVNLLPGLIIVGAFAIPFSVLVLFLELNVPRNVSLYQVVKLLLLGGVLSLIVALVLFDVTAKVGSWAGPMIAGPVEETAKVLALLLVVRRLRYRWTLNGLLFGATVGCGFAAFETAGYALTFGLQGLLHGLEDGQGYARMLDGITKITNVRGALTICGSHIVYTAISGAALWRVRGQRRFQFAMLGDIRFLRLFAFSVGLHVLWNSPIPDTFYIKYAVIGLVGWTLVIALVNDGMRQIRTAKEELETSARNLATSIFGATNAGGTPGVGTPPRSFDANAAHPAPAPTPPPPAAPATPVAPAAPQRASVQPPAASADDW
jgi:RsiW-degrading membrane proteinase PrsW (M82 family)